MHQETPVRRHEMEWRLIACISPYRHMKLDLSVRRCLGNTFPCERIGRNPAGLIGMPFSSNLDQGGELFATIVHRNH